LLQRQRGRTSRRMTKVFGVVAVVGAGTLGLLFLVTPSAGNATARVRSQAGTHRIAYPSSPPPRRLVESLVATEDRRFYSLRDPGVDPFAIARAILAGLVGQRRDPGGSTITHQLAKMLYTPGRNGLAAKLEQVVLAVKLSFTYSRA
jgi:membrane peptidoglycan carboxypeptidase